MKDITKNDYHAGDKWIYFTQQEFNEILKNQKIVKHLEDCEECQQYGNGFCKTYGDLT